MVIRSAFHALTITSRHNRSCLVVCLDGWVSSSRGAIQALVTWVGGSFSPSFSYLHPSHSGYHSSFCFTSLPPSFLQQASCSLSLSLGSLSLFRRPPSSFLSSLPSLHLPFSLSLRREPRSLPSVPSPMYVYVR